MEIHYGLNATEEVSEVKALLFDTFGTLVDWRSSLIGELIAYGRKRGISADWTLLVDKWRSAYYPSMDRVRKGEQPWTTLDILHRQSLERLVREQEIHGISEGDLDEMTRAWHRLRPWPDVLDGMRRLATRYLLGSLSNEQRIAARASAKIFGSSLGRDSGRGSLAALQAGSGNLSGSLSAPGSPSGGGHVSCSWRFCGC